MGKDGFAEYVVHDLLGHIEDVSSRAMFGGHGIYKDSVIFGLIVSGELYFKVGDSNIKDYQEKGSEPFTYEGKKKPVKMSYWKLPVEVMEDADEIRLWMERSIEVSLKTKRKKKKKSK